MKKDTTQKKKMIPSYAILPLLICIAVNFTVYIGTDKLMEHRNFYDLTLPVDRMVPVIPALYYDHQNEQKPLLSFYSGGCYVKTCMWFLLYCNADNECASGSEWNRYFQPDVKMGVSDR